MKVIVPCCGRSSRFPNLPPKWMLPDADGRPMICAAVGGLKFNPDDLIVTLLREHEERFNVTEGLKNAFGRPIFTCILEQQTRSQSDTVAQTIRALSLDEPFFVKDSDNSYEVDEIERTDNYVCVDSLNNYDSINPRNKSYLQVSQNGLVTNIREKEVISDTFNVGGYFFTNPTQFLEYFDRLSANTAEWNREIYLSDVIGSMILDGIPFRSRPVGGYRDWGTIREWRRALAPQRTYFVQLDGFLFERGNRYFNPRFNDVRPQATAVAAVRILSAQGRKIVYLSIRPAETAELTARQLREADLPPGPIVFDCSVSQWQLVTAPQETLPFKSGGAIELAPDHPELAALLQIIPDGD
jgi:hypothetical protein